jgi:hypothetical protein
VWWTEKENGLVTHSQLQEQRQACCPLQRHRIQKILAVELAEAVPAFCEDYQHGDAFRLDRNQSKGGLNEHYRGRSKEVILLEASLRLLLRNRRIGHEVIILNYNTCHRTPSEVRATASTS